MNKKGMTMVEVSVGFLIIMICFAMFTGTVRFSGQMLGKYQRIRDSYEEEQEVYYQNKKKEPEQSGGKIQNQSGVTFSLTLQGSESEERKNLALPSTSLRYFQLNQESGKKYFFNHEAE